MIDAAANGQGKYLGKAFFFKADRYLRYDWNKDSMDPGYPLPIAGNWSGLPGNIDAAINGQGKYAGKAYFFKGDQYFRYDWNKDSMDSGYPLPIAGNWPGLDLLSLSDDVIVQHAKKERDSAMMTAASELMRLEALLTAGIIPLSGDNAAKAVEKWLLVPMNHPDFSKTVSAAVDLINRNLLVQTNIRIDRSLNNDYANVGAVGVPSSGITIQNPFFITNPLCRREVIAHEFFHLSGLVHHYGTTDPKEAIQCAHHMAELVFEIATGETLGCEKPQVTCISPAP